MEGPESLDEDRNVSKVVNDHVLDDRGQLPTGVRRARVLDLVRQRQFVSVAGLRETFGVSEVTIRNDLDTLAEEGHLRRVRGGAVHAATAGPEAPFEKALGARAVEKALIGAAAAELVDSGQTIFLDAGTTAVAVARALAARTDLDELTIFTNGLRIALELEPAVPRFAVIVTGGTLRTTQHSLVNPLAGVILEQVHAHIGFLECDGIDPEAGVTSISVAEAEVKRLMMRAARRRVVVADGSKVGQIGLVHLYDVDEVDDLITDDSADPELVEALGDHSIDVVVSRR